MKKDLDDPPTTMYNAGIDMTESSAARHKTDPVPTRFDQPEDTFLQELAKTTGISRSELVRRSVRLMRRQAEQLKSNHFLLDLCA